MTAAPGSQREHEVNIIVNVLLSSAGSVSPTEKAERIVDLLSMSPFHPKPKRIEVGPVVASKGCPVPTCECRARTVAEHNHAVTHCPTPGCPCGATTEDEHDTRDASSPESTP